MSEYRDGQYRQLRPEVDSDQKKAFTKVYAHIMRFASEQGEPIKVEKHSWGISHMHRDLWDIAGTGEDFSQDANGLEATCYKPDGTERPGWIYVNDESGADTSGYLAIVSFQPSPLDYDQDSYTFFPDSNVAHEKYQPNDNEDVQFDHWMSADEIEALGTLLETAEPGWLPRSYPEEVAS